ncbi:MAG TPA: DUF4403 family protein, partial [Longimicrobiales bacterium]
MRSSRPPWTAQQWLVRAGPALLVLLAACHGAPPSGDLAEDAPPPPPTTLSRFSAPVDYDFTPVLAVLERVVPARFGSLDSLHVMGKDEHKHYAFEAERGSLTAFAEGGLLHLRATVAYSAKAFYKPPIGPTLTAGCGKGDDRPRIVLELATPITLTSSWHLRSHARIVRLEPASTEARDRCDVSVVKYDVTPKVVEAARKALEKHLPDIDRKIAAVDLRERFAGWWAALGRPIHLSEGVWLVLDPQAVEMGRVSGSGHVLTVPVTVAARPRIVTAAVVPQVDAPELPTLGHEAAAEGFHVLLEGAVDYATASRVITTALAHRRISSAGRQVTIDSVVVAPGGHRRLDVAVAFSGDAHGTLHLVGRPELDRARGEITVPDLDYDLDTDNQLVNAFAWLRSDALRQVLRDKAHVP